MIRVVTFGEIMLRLKSPGHERLFQSPLLEATFGGGEANVAVSLARFGMGASFVTVLPSGPVADAALSSLRYHGVDVSGAHRSTTGRTGIYFLETGSDQRPSGVVYDRAGSAMSLAGPGDIDWRAVLGGASWFHCTGITPALSQSAADLALEGVRAARSMGLAVSIDLNYRKKLWNYGVPAREMMTPLVREATLLIANEEDIQLALGLGAVPEHDRNGASGGASRGGSRVADYRALADMTRTAFPNLERVAVTMRESRSADRNGWSAVLSGKTFMQSKYYELDDIVDRVGGGDSFAAGLIFGLQTYDDEQTALEFAVAASALKHSIPGDYNLVSREEVEALMRGGSGGRVSR